MPSPFPTPARATTWGQAGVCPGERVEDGPLLCTLHKPRHPTGMLPAGMRVGGWGRGERGSALRASPRTAHDRDPQPTETRHTYSPQSTLPPWVGT